MRRGTKKYSLEELYNIASLYYHEKKTQDAIAKIADKTRQEVAAMLREAEEKGLVSINLLTPESLFPSDRFIEKLHKRFPVLVSCKIVSDLPPGASGFGDWIERVPFNDIAASMWDLFTQHIRVPITIAIGSSRIIRETLTELCPRIARRIPLELVPMVGHEYAVGYTAESNTEYLDNMQYDAPELDIDGFYPFPVPAYANMEQRQWMATVPMIQRTLDVHARINVVVAYIHPRDAVHESYPDRSFESPLAAVGDLSGFLFGDGGEALDDKFQPFGLGVERLRELAARQETLVIGLSLTPRHGHDVAQTTLAALQSGFVNTLIIDVRIAKSLEELLDDASVCTE